MCSPGFDRAELGLVREALWNAQYMGRIGNLVTTWQRELGDDDFTSGVFARALTHGDLTLEMLRGGQRDHIAAAIEQNGHEEFFLNRWGQHRQFLLQQKAKVRSANLGDLVAGLEKLVRLHLASRGHK
jgi:hypothetical protein